MSSVHSPNSTNNSYVPVPSCWKYSDEKDNFWNYNDEKDNFWKDSCVINCDGG